MNLLHGLFVTLFLAEYLDHTRNVQIHLHAQVIGGQTASKPDFPYHVQIVRKEVPSRSNTLPYSCGGSIISAWKILTAAHCVNVKDGLVVFIRSADSIGGILRPIHRASRFIHPEYNASTAENDVAVLLLDEPLTIDATNIDTINLPEKDYELKDGTMLTVSGFGAIKYTKNPKEAKKSESLQYLEVPVVNFEKCRKHYARKECKDCVVTSKMFCAGFYSNKRCFFNGDSGGPIVYKPHKLQVGIVSWSLSKLPGVYVKISEFREWIDSITHDTLALRLEQM